MKKLLSILALVCVAIGCWAFYPKTSAESGYMMLLLDSSNQLTIIYPNGQEERQTIKLKFKGPSPQVQVLIKLNELRSQGWTVAQMHISEYSTPDPSFPKSPDHTRSETYLLEKR
ncbi:hypothetical protein [Hymenobacter sp. DG25A]|uniref:hypothetical protein n=1 Tax=Hymenobacter sp. DG25A TaxID=1385663 RepID=UPI0006BD47BE|nr:hypothetical protein [Hymenobacter sp. DG25A]ALD20134.1 hypothetical protein AM218_01410 [Hymenobacter sp. DG25A]